LDPQQGTGPERGRARAQVLELPNKSDKIMDLQWEPHGSRFAVLHGEGPRPSFSVYAMKDMRTSAKGVQLVGTQTGKQANCIFWSPQARPRARALPYPTLPALLALPQLACFGGWRPLKLTSAQCACASRPCLTCALRRAAPWSGTVAVAHAGGRGGRRG